ncbi:MAG TPA: accessory Sec system translocase SecA2 [Desulfitobacteriaceae bacterium]|nr:accessory Sec system translocase SecA2 [Desulfitobacteriaceae bacterium]
MFKKLSQLNHFMRNLHNPVEYNIEPYRKVLREINKIKLESASDNMLKEKSIILKYRACKGDTAERLLTESFALVREAARRVLKLYPFDVQVMAGIALHRGKIVEMQTGEGKTLAAVMPAYLNALTGKGVHILTFNDYLARRDAGWMGPLYEFLGLTVGYVKEGMSIGERQKAYFSDITYVTAKEAGFDYLRDFLCMEKEQLVHRPFHYAIVDEADSILIDEARIPLVIAGELAGNEENGFDLSKIVRDLKLGKDYEIAENGKNIYLTDTGLLHVEELIACANLYDLNNLELLTRLNCTLHAEFLLKRDKDYIVRNGKVEIIDEFTGRVADKRHWPDNLQEAVEVKESLLPKTKGTIMGSIALQHYLSLYPKISGMTGTAVNAAEEFGEFYGLEVVAIPTNKPCIRVDHPDLIFTHKEAKQKALVAEIKRRHETGQPILIGTGSVEESELLAADLRNIGIKCQVLNAKNNEMEAQLIARAGEPKAVTVSTNMAGRGIDIKLGGDTGQERDLVVALGGLYVIGTNRHESCRIDNQLKGRAERQGDPGESRFFTSLEDDLIKKFNITQEMPLCLPAEQENPVHDPIIRRELVRGQRIIEGYNSDLRKQLWKYSFIIEQQRRIIHQRHHDILLDKTPLELLAREAPERYSILAGRVGEKVLREVEKQITLYYLNKCWAEYLDNIAYERESIHLVVFGGKNPLDEFHKIAIETFAKMLERIDSEIIGTFNVVDINENGIELEKEGLKGPSSTWTYLINDNPDQFNNLQLWFKVAATAISRPLFTVRSAYRRIMGK